LAALYHGFEGTKDSRNWKRDTAMAGGVSLF
jgi:hypothetical protein